MPSRLLGCFVTAALIFTCRRVGRAQEKNLQFPPRVIAYRQINRLPSASEPQVTVHVYNYSSTASSGLHKAEAEAALLFAHANLELIWIDMPMRVSDDKPRERTDSWPRGVNLILNILPESRVARLHPPLSELGSTTGVTSSVFVDRIQPVSRYLDPYVILGHVIAHELAHALGVHHSGGLMSKNISGDWPVQAEQHRLQFSPKQVAQMQQAVRIQTAALARLRQ